MSTQRNSHLKGKSLKGTEHLFELRPGSLGNLNTTLGKGDSDQIPRL